MRIVIGLLLLLIAHASYGQSPFDSIPKHDSITRVLEDTALRIVNLSPYFTQHVDSSLSYQFLINRPLDQYYWYLKNAPVGLKINKDNGTLSFKADKAYFLSGRLQYDRPYKVLMGVQNMSNPKDKVDTSFTVLFYNTEIIPSTLRPTISSTVTVDEGETVSFKVLCDAGSFPIERINFTSDRSLENYSLVEHCGDEFKWTPSFEFVKETDPGKTKTVVLNFIGATKFGVKDTASIRLIVRDALNYPLAVQEYRQLVKNIQDYILQLKFTFLYLDKKLKHTKSSRMVFDLTTASTSLAGTVLNTQNGTTERNLGKILPSVGLSMVPIKEAVAPNKNVEQNQATQLRAMIKRLEYMITDNELIGDRDDDIVRKMNKLKEEWKQAQVQLLDIPLEITNGMSAEELNRYFNSNKVNKKYRMKKRG